MFKQPKFNVLAAAIAGACLVAAGAASAQAGVSIEPLVSGTLTYERPEVGLVIVNGGGCTGTLIADRWVLTAAHCSGHLTIFDTAGTGGNSFSIDRSATDRRTYAVERIYSLGFPIGTKDVMLLRLATPVPATVATPAAMAVTAPAAGSSITVYGYGCNATTPSLAGRKQKMTGTVQIGSIGEFSSTNTLCPGDSGGPAFSGTRVFGVNSQMLGTPPTQVDIFADVPRRYSELVSLMVSADSSVGGTDTTMSGWCTGSRQRLFYGDIDGNNVVDALCHDESTGVLSYAQGTTGAIRPRGVRGGTFCLGPTSEVHVGDFDGDRRTDVLCLDRGTGRKDIEFSTGSWTAPYGSTRRQTSDTRWCSHTTAQLHIGDFNGDGKSDLLCHDTSTGMKWIDYANGSTPTMLFGTNDWDNAGNWCSHSTATLLTGDFDGDGRTDLLCHTRANGGLDVKLARAGDVFGATTFWQDTTANFCTGGAGRVVGFETTGDGRAELHCLQPAGGGARLISMGGAGVPFEPAVSWSRGTWGAGKTRPLMVGNVAATPWPRQR